MSPYIYALFGFLFFGLGSQFFTKYSRSISPIWVNCFKGTLALFCFLITVILTGGFQSEISTNILFFMVSGFIGLGIGDVFLMKAFADMGPGRTLILFSLQPFITGVLSYIFLGQKIDSVKAISIAMFIICIFIFSLESYKKSGHWGIKSILIAFAGIAMDSCGVILTRIGFDSVAIRPVEANFFRAVGAVISFILIANIFKINFFKTLKNLSTKVKVEISIGAFLGAYLSLVFYLMAIRGGHLSSLSAMSITGVLFAAGFECLFEKKLPSKYLIVAFVFFAIGMFLLLK